MSSEFLTPGASPVPNVSKEALDKILRHHVWGAMGVGVIPVPVVDIAALTGVQLNLLRKLGNLYNMTFAEQTVMKIISSLFSSVMPTALGPSLAISLAKTIPLLGPSLGVVTMPLVFGASTYALGKVFIQHFESGGTFLTFDPDKVKAHYAAMFQEGKEVAAEMQAGQTAQVEQTEQGEQPPSPEQEKSQMTSEPQTAPTVEDSSDLSEKQETEAENIQDVDVLEAQESDSSSKKSRRRKLSLTK